MRGDDTAATALARVETGAAMAVLLDRADDSAFGGTGQALDWRVASEIAGAMPLWLAGGLTPDNVASAIAAVRPWCVDVSSGVETDGVKDARKIRAFMQAVKAMM